MLVVFFLWLSTAFADGDDARFLPAQNCALCHTRIPRPGGSWQDQAGWVGPSQLWKNSMMAFAAQDPYWRAKVEFETALVPVAKAAIEDKCLRCHAPTDQYSKRARGGQLALSEVTDMGREGVTCTVCHQIEEAGLGRASSFTGSFTLGTKDRIYGPFPEPFTMPMLHHTGYTATEVTHIRQSALCGTCHTVITHPIGGQREFIEQAPFLEWLASDYPKRGETCQACHMPQLEGPQYIAHRPPGGAFPPTSPRSPSGRHLFAGGNTLVPAVLGKAETEARARQQLGRALRLDVRTLREEGTAIVSVTVTNLTGHKLPTAYPSRRLWLHVRATGAAGEVAFESGAWEGATGELRGDGEAAVFEAEFEDADGRATVSLLRASRYRKDTRILPVGFQPERLQAAGLHGFDIASVGGGRGMEFRPGSATVTYRIPKPGPLALTVEALFQTVKPSHALPGFATPAGLSGPATIATAHSNVP